MCLLSTTLKAEELFSTSFQTEDEFNQWKVVDGNNDASTWAFDDAAEPSKVFYSYNSANAAEDWLISPQVMVTEDCVLSVVFSVQGSSYGEKMEVYYGTEQTVEAMTTMLSETLALGGEVTNHLYLVNAKANEPIYFGFKACSDADKWRLYLCDVKIASSQNPVDLKVSGFTSPVSDFDLDQEAVTIKIANMGFVDVDSFDVSFSVGENEAVTETVNQKLAMGEEMEYTFNAKADLSEPRKNFDIKAWTSHVDDVNTNNDTFAIKVLHKAPASVPYSMGFELSEYTDGITFFNLNEDDGDWTLFTDPWISFARTGDFCLGYNYNKYNNANDWAILEPIKIEEAGYYVLKFWYSGDNNHPEKLGVYYGSQATPEAMTNKIVEYAPFARSAYEESINIIKIDQPQDIYIGFYAFSDKDENWICIDDVTFEKIDAEAIDIMTLPISKPIDYVHQGTDKSIKFKVRNLGIKDVKSTVTVKIDDNLVYQEEVDVLAQEIKDIEIKDALTNLEMGMHNIVVDVVTADDTNVENNTQTLQTRVMGTPDFAWNFEDGQLPTDFIFRAEDEGTVNPDAGGEFYDHGWGIMNIGTHELYGEHMLAGTSWLDGTDQADRWCILPPFKPNDESYLVWDVASFNPNFLESYSVMISTSGDDEFYYFTEEEFVAESAEFKTRGLDLSGYSGKNIYIAFRLRSKNCDNLLLDNIELYGGSKVELLEVTATSDPKEGIVEKIDNITVTFVGVESVEVDKYYYFYPFHIAKVNEDGTMEKYADVVPTAVDGQPTQVNIALKEEGASITEPGKYALVMSRRTLLFNDDSDLLITTKEFVLNYEIEAPKPQFTITISPAEGEIKADDMKVFTVTLEGLTSFSFALDTNQGTLQRLNEDGSVAEEYMSNVLITAENAYTITPINPPTEKGLYRLTIPAGSLTVKDTNEVEGTNEEFVVNYKVTEAGIEGLQADAVDLTVYDVNGVCVLQNATYNELKQLAKGIYIVNGKKMVIR